MTKFVMIMWWVIQTHGVESDGTHNYYLRNGNWHLSIPNAKEELPYGPNANIRLKVEMECTKSEQQAPNVRHMQILQKEFFCTAIKYEIMPCRPHESALFNGRLYC